VVVVSAILLIVVVVGLEYGLEYFVVFLVKWVYGGDQLGVRVWDMHAAEMKNLGWWTIYAIQNIFTTK